MHDAHLPGGRLSIQQSDACIRRRFFQNAYVDKLLADPEVHFTRIHGSKLWHLVLWERCLQVHINEAVAGSDHV